MQHIFVDFEMTCWRRKDKISGKKIAEIIDIGAVKLDEAYQIIDRFSLFVQPEYNTVLSKTCLQLTGITQENLADAPFLVDALCRFEEWIGDEEVKFYAWGHDDRNQIRRECQEKNLYPQMPRVYRRWLNLQNIFMRVYGFNKRLGLLHAVEMVGFEFQGQQHRAVYDALNGARLLILMKDKEEHQKKKAMLAEFYNNQEQMTTTLGEILNGKLSGLEFVS